MLLSGLKKNKNTTTLTKSETKTTASFLRTDQSTEKCKKNAFFIEQYEKNS